MTLIVDASVALKWFVDEQGSDRALALLEGPERLVAPDIAVSEICNGAWRMARTRAMPEAQVRSIVSTISEVVDEFFPSLPLAARALAIARALDHPAYDCFYVALSEVLECPVVTADARLLRRLQGTEWEERLRPLLPLSKLA